MKFYEKQKAISLRQQGQSYTEILSQVHVSKGTLSAWLKDITLTKEQEERLFVTRRQEHIANLAKLRKNLSQKKKTLILSQAAEEAGTFIADPLFLTGLMLYWAEGDKSEYARAVKFTNSDPRMIALMMKWFRVYGNVREEKVRIEIHIHELLEESRIKAYWSRIVGIPETQFYKTQIKQTSLRQRRVKLYHGTCAIRIGDITLLRKIHGWKLGALKHIAAEVLLHEIQLDHTNPA